MLRILQRHLFCFCSPDIFRRHCRTKEGRRGKRNYRWGQTGKTTARWCVASWRMEPSRLYVHVLEEARSGTDSDDVCMQLVQAAGMDRRKPYLTGHRGSPPGWTAVAPACWEESPREQASSAGPPSPSCRQREGIGVEGSETVCVREEGGVLVTMI